MVPPSSNGPIDDRGQIGERELAHLELELHLLVERGELLADAAAHVFELGRDLSVEPGLRLFRDQTEPEVELHLVFSLVDALAHLLEESRLELTELGRDLVLERLAGRVESGAHPRFDLSDPLSPDVGRLVEGVGRLAQSECGVDQGEHRPGHVGPGDDELGVAAQSAEPALEQVDPRKHPGGLERAEDLAGLAAVAVEALIEPPVRGDQPQVSIG